MSSRSRRRFLLLAGLGGLPGVGSAQQRRALADPMRLGVDRALHESRLAPALQRAFGRDTGVAVKLVPGTATSVLQALELGEVDAALCNSPLAESRLEALGFAPDRVPVATGEFVIVGPVSVPSPAARSSTSPKPSPRIRTRDPAGLAGLGNAAGALQRLAESAATGASPGFLTSNDGSGTHAAEQALWRAAKIAPAAPWYHSASPGAGLIDSARGQSLYALVERGAWAARGGPPLAIVVQGDPVLRVDVHFMRSFRSRHAATKLFSSWLTGAKGRAIVAAHSGYRVPR